MGIAHFKNLQVERAREQNRKREGQREKRRRQGLGGVEKERGWDRLEEGEGKGGRTQSKCRSLNLLVTT